MTRTTLSSGISLLIVTTAAAHGQSCGSIDLSQTIDNVTIVDGRGIGCESGGVSRETHYVRSYDLSLCPMSGREIGVSCVTFGVEFNTIADYAVDVNIFQDTDGGAPIAVGTDLLLMGTVSVLVPEVIPANGIFITADFAGGPGTVVLPPDATMVVELVLPTREGGDEGSMRPAFNDLGQTEDSYIQAVECGLPSYTTLDSIGFFDNDLIQVVSVDQLAPFAPCPGDCFNGDGFVNVPDLIELLNTWGQTGSVCDIAGGDDIVNVPDLIEMLSGWGNCPPRLPFCITDINGDGDINVPDLLVLLTDWGVTPDSLADFDCTGEVNVPDLLALLGDWGTCAP